MDPLVFFKALADVTRLHILMLLSEHREVCVCELTASLKLSQPKISRHLALLRKAGLIQDHRQGAWVYYRLHVALPRWCRHILDETLQQARPPLLMRSDAVPRPYSIPARV
jgi:ArsR family transcriptional regulator